MQISGWGRYPSIESEVIRPLDAAEISDLCLDSGNVAMIARGLGRSYGDSSLASKAVSTLHLNHFSAFDEVTGLLTCTSGMSLADILSVFVPKGWFLPVTPGTKYITIGGAIASDVHGKNHHIDGSFTDHVDSLKIATVTGGVLECSRNSHSELFHATCGGMGLTGVILEATFRLIPIESAYINETTIKAHNLREALALIDECQDARYSVAWIDCLSTGESLGRSLLMLGQHSAYGKLDTGKTGRLSVPVDMPGFLLNQYSIQAFNALYYHRVRKNRSIRDAHYEPYFYPLDGIQQWNRLYGKKGFLQYQFVLPRAAGCEGMTVILRKIAASKRGSFLAVLKAFGERNRNYLSFPIEGYTLALDFKRDPELFGLLDELDRVVLDYGGRLYLSKDARMSEEVFKKSYPEWEKFMDVRVAYGAEKLFNSMQSKRLGL